MSGKRLNGRSRRGKNSINSAKLAIGILFTGQIYGNKPNLTVIGQRLAKLNKV
jgi:hypothetical protein